MSGFGNCDRGLAPGAPLPPGGRRQIPAKALGFARRYDPYLVHLALVPVWTTNVAHDLVHEGRWPASWIAAWIAVAAAIWLLALPLMSHLRRRESIFPAVLVPALTAYAIWALPPFLFLALARGRGA